MLDKALRDELDRRIASYVRALAPTAPVTEEAIGRYIRGAARMRVTETDVADRIAYLVQARFLERRVEWENGEIERFECTADGMDWLDGARPPRNWTRPSREG